MSLTLLGAGPEAGGFDPLSLSPSHWYKMYTLGLADTAAPTSLPDSSGNARTIISSAIVGLTFRTNVQNGRSAVRGAAANALAEFPAGNNVSRTSTVFIVAKYNAAYSAVAALFGLDASATWRITRTSSTNMQSVGSDKTTTPEEWHVYAADFGAGILYVDGSAGTTSTALSGANTNARLWRDANNASIASADLGEVFIAPAGLSTANRQAMEAYLKLGWATP